MTQTRIEVFEQMLTGDPANTMVLFGLAKEYEKAGDDAKLIETLEKYFAAAEDEGNAYGMLARAFERTNQPKSARSVSTRSGSGDGTRPSGNGGRVQGYFGKRIFRVVNGQWPDLRGPRRAARLGWGGKGGFIRIMSDTKVLRLVKKSEGDQHEGAPAASPPRRCRGHTGPPARAREVPASEIHASDGSCEAARTVLTQPRRDVEDLPHDVLSRKARR